MVSTHLKNISQNWNLLQVGVKTKVWNHNLVQSLIQSDHQFWVSKDDTLIDFLLQMAENKWVTGVIGVVPYTKADI